MDKLWLNSELADLGESRAAINFQAWGLLTLSNRQSPYSFSFTLPDTAVNRGLLGVPLMGSLTTIPYTKTPAMYEADGVFIIGPGGYLIIERIDNQGDFAATIYSGTSEFFSLIKDKKITELTTLDNMNWLLSTLATAHRAQWPVIDWNEEQPNAQFDDNPYDELSCMEVDILKMYPGETLKTIIAAIFAEAGYTIFDAACEPWTNAKFLRMFVPCINQYASPLVGPQMLQCECKSINLTILGGFVATQTYCYLSDITSYISNWANILYMDGDPGGAQTDCMFCNIRSKGLYGFHVEATFHWSGSGGYAHVLAFEVWSLTEGRALYGTTFHIGTTAGDLTVEINQNVEVTGISVIGVRLYDASWEPARVLTVSDWHFTAVKAEPENTAYGYDFDIALNLPPFTQLDFVKAWLNMTCSMLWVDEESKLIYVYKFSDLYKNTPEDWTDYFDSIDEVSYHPDGFAQSNKLNYANDDTVWKDTGLHAVTLTDEALPEEIDLIDLPFSATDDVMHGNDTGVVGGVPVGKIAIRKAGVVENAVTGRVLLRDSVALATLPVKFVADVLSATYNPCYFAKFSGLEWGQLVQDSYLELFLRTLDKARVVRANFVLPATVVKNRKSNIPVYVRQLNGLFYCDIIENYIAGEMCIVQLIRL